MNAAARLEAALESLSAAFIALDNAVGSGGTPHAHAALLEVRADLAYQIRRVKRVALMSGADPARCEELTR
jgi:hypothetical protein